MIEIYSNRDSATVGQFQSLLESAGIKTYFRNEFESATTVAVPGTMPALCILDEADLDRSVELIRSYTERAEVAGTKELTCPKCGEKSPGTFETCWNCGSALPVG